MPEAPITTPLVNDRGRAMLVNVWTRFGTERKMGGLIFILERNKKRITYNPGSEASDSLHKSKSLLGGGKLNRKENLLIHMKSFLNLAQRIHLWLM